MYHQTKHSTSAMNPKQEEYKKEKTLWDSKLKLLKKETKFKKHPENIYFKNIYPN